MAFYILQPPSFLNVHRTSWITFSKAQECSAKSSRCAGLWLCVTSPIHTALSNAVRFLRRLLLKHWTKMPYPQSLSSHKRPVASLQDIIVEMEEHVLGAKEERIRRESIELLTPVFISMLRKVTLSFEQEWPSKLVIAQWVDRDGPNCSRTWRVMILKG